MTRVLSIGADRSKQGILFPNTPAFRRQEAYAKELGNLDIIGFSRKEDGAINSDAQSLRVFPTNSSSKLRYGLDALRIAKTLQKPDVVSVQDPFEAGLVGWRIARHFGVPLHVQIHTDFLSPEYARHSFFNRVRVRLARFVLARASGVRVVSERIRRSMEAAHSTNAPIAVLPIYADINRVRADIDPTITSRFSAFPTKALVVSRLEPEKNVTLALRAFAQSAPKDACLVILGDGSERKALERLARKSKVSDRVFFEGMHDSAAYYAFADIVLVTSKYEGYGLVIIEALAAGKPVLSTDVGIARQAGVMVADEHAFAATLAKWFINGPREMRLAGYPYKDFDEYVRAYCDDVRACTNVK
jgi:glycosyltransferase involved in cell wall biosynthesis